VNWCCASFRGDLSWRNDQQDQHANDEQQVIRGREWVDELSVQRLASKHTLQVHTTTTLAQQNDSQHVKNAKIFSESLQKSKNINEKGRNVCFRSPPK
jgi:hypothetical protein